jgi:hypothetical protein
MVHFVFYKSVRQIMREGLFTGLVVCLIILWFGVMVVLMILTYNSNWLIQLGTLTLILVYIYMSMAILADTNFVAWLISKTLGEL